MRDAVMRNAVMRIVVVRTAIVRADAENIAFEKTAEMRTVVSI